MNKDDIIIKKLQTKLETAVRARSSSINMSVDEVTLLTSYILDMYREINNLQSKLIESNEQINEITIAPTLNP